VALVDWNAQQHELRPSQPGATAGDVSVKATLAYAILKIDWYMQHHGEGLRCNLDLRAYHGWTDKTDTVPKSRELSALSQMDFVAAGTERVALRTISFGDKSLATGNRRLVTLGGREMHFPGTLVDKEIKARPPKKDEARWTCVSCKAENTPPKAPKTERLRGEKMVDTALVSDLIWLASRPDEDCWLFVLGTDIDLVPGLFTAESMLNDTTRRLVYLRCNGIDLSNCEGLVQALPRVRDLRKTFTC
jgi:hypothetical protein